MTDELTKLAEAITFHKWAIIGPYGNIWTPELFDKPSDAEEHLRSFWGRNGFENGKWFATPVEVTVQELGGKYERAPLVFSALKSRASQ